MAEDRHIRFANIDGLDLHDLPVAGEIWLDELGRQPWVSRETLKLANHFKRYMDRPDPRMLILSRIESECHIDKELIVETVRQMYIYGAVSGYAVENNVLRVSLNLTVLQRLRALETGRRLIELTAFENRARIFRSLKPENGWVPEKTGQEEESLALQEA